MDSSGESKVNYIGAPQLPSEPHELCVCPTLAFSVLADVCALFSFSLLLSLGSLMVIHFYSPIFTSFAVVSVLYPSNQLSQRGHISISDITTLVVVAVV